MRSTRGFLARTIGTTGKKFPANESGTFSKSGKRAGFEIVRLQKKIANLKALEIEL